MKKLLTHIVKILILSTTVLNAQSFDLMTAGKSNKVAASAHFAVTKNGIEEFIASTPSHPFIVITGDTLHIEKITNTTSVQSREITPTQSSLQQNFPNPFNNSTVIRYSLEKESDVTITVYDVAGREIKTLVNESKQSGTFSVGFSNQAIASGTYFYRLIAKNKDGNVSVETKKMIVMK